MAEGVEKWSDSAKWIWVSAYDDTLPEGQIALFRKTLYLNHKPTSPCTVKVSADTRYRLFVNGISVSFGPCKSYRERWYYEIVDISQHLKQGPNVLHARVLRFSPRHAGSFSLMPGPFPGLIVDGRIPGTDISLHTDSSWEGRPDRAVSMLPRSEWNYALGPPFLAMNERVDGSLADVDWHTSPADLWKPVKIMTSKSIMLPVLEPLKLVKRPIPVLPEIEKRFDGVTTCTGTVDLSSWAKFARSPSSLEIPPHTTVSVDFEVKELTTGFTHLRCLAGAGATIRMLCAESYEKPLERNGPGAKRFKSDRADFTKGKLYGQYDYYKTRRGLNIIEPFWFRAFRYVQLEITTLADPLTLTSFDFRETHYPLDIQSQVSVSKELDQMWKISLNTLRNCMHETYEDCPFYEQNQFIQDSRLQLLFTYQLSRDDRLARKTIHEFHASQGDDGLLQAQFPTSMRAVNIPQFSLFWVLMLYDHMMYFGDAKFIKRYLGTLDRVLDYFDDRVNDKGLVGQFDDECWPFVDWVKEWHGSRGFISMAVPPAYWTTGAATYNSLLYAFSLQHAAAVCEYLARPDTAREYRKRADSLNAAVNQYCFDGQMYTDGPGSDQHSEHAQVFAVLSGAIGGQAATKLIRQTLQNQSIPKCSYSLSFYVLRAVEKVGIYSEAFNGLLQPWRKMMADNLTTWAEDDVMFRSDCHGWSASPVYETVSQVFGLSPTTPGYKTARMNITSDLLPVGARGKLVTADGHVTVVRDTIDSITVSSSTKRELEIVVDGVREPQSTVEKDQPLVLRVKRRQPIDDDQILTANGHLHEESLPVRPSDVQVH